MEKKTFEEAILNLEKLIKELEAGELPLEETVKKYKEGLDLAKYCHELLETAEKEIIIVEEE